MTERTDPPRLLGSAPSGAIERLSGVRVYFGHQSVGFNIIEGMSALRSDKAERTVSFLEDRDIGAHSGPAFLHSTIGQNGDPLGKIREFDSVLRDGAARPVDIAFMKLCYADIMPDTDIAAVFHSYRDTLARLKADFPRTTFVHFTVPLLTRAKGLKPLVKRLLGRQVWGFEDNLNRERLNKLLRSEYEGKEPLFDIALLESTRPDGSRTAYKSGDETYFALEQAYTTDGGHLNERGRTYIAEQLLLLLIRKLQ